MKLIANISRIIVGLTFIFSGFVKGIDPLGFTYKLQDYFFAYHIEWLSPLALVFAIFMCMLEFTVGIALIATVKIRLMAWLTLIIMLFFTILTFISAIFNPVSDCGCFGDAIKLTNWETFWKNVILMIFVTFLFIYRKKFRNIWTNKGSNFIIITSSILFIGFCIYNLYFLPIIDFLPWKKGNVIKELVIPQPEVSEIRLVYENVNTKEEKEFTTEEFAKSEVWKDSLWLATWKFKEQRKKIIKPFVDAPIHDFKIEDEHGDDLINEFINDTTTVFFVVAYDLNKTAKSSYKKITEFVSEARKAGINTIGLTATEREKINSFKKEYNINFDFYTTDETALKTIIRSNPGIVLIKKGVVAGKWSYLGLPSFEKVKNKELIN